MPNLESSILGGDTMRIGLEGFIMAEPYQSDSLSNERPGESEPPTFSVLIHK